MGSNIVKLNIDTRKVEAGINKAIANYSMQKIKNKFLLNTQTYFVNRIQAKIVALKIYKTGTLMKSITSGVKSAKPENIHLFVAAGVHYAIHHEKGTGQFGPIPSTSRIKNGGLRPRPYFMNTIVENSQEFFNAVAADLRRIK